VRAVLAHYPPGLAVRVAALSAILAIGIGSLIAVSPILGLAAGAVLVVLWLVAQGPRLPVIFLGALGFILAGYAFLSRGFAHVGVPPVYVGEPVLAIAVLSMIVTVRRARLSQLHGLLFVFMLWGLVRTVPFISRDGLDALRDGVLWGYVTFAFAVSFAMRPGYFSKIVAWYRKVVPAFLCWVPIAMILTRFFGDSLPKPPGSKFSIIVVNTGDISVHLAGVAAFLLLGLYADKSSRGGIREVLLWMGWFLAFAAVSAISRGGMLAASAGPAIPFVLRCSRRWLSFIGIGIVLACLLMLVNPTIPTDRGRPVSARQLASNVVSIVSDTGHEGLDGTKEWRLDWWNKIVDYTIQGPYFWTGKGFGVNLADDDDFTLTDDHALRSPHNGHMTVLARMGVSGIVFWTLLHTVFGASLLRAFFQARRRGDIFWSRIDVWLLVYWLAILIDAAFDVYIEGPQGGIWLWTVFGLGLAALAAQRDLERQEVNGSELPTHSTLMVSR
jgi:hypothetical protein